MQSAYGKQKKWVLEFLTKETQTNPLMGWESSTDTLEEVVLKFNTKEQAIEWAKKNSYQFFVEEPKVRKVKIKSYASNFDINKKESWTH